MTSTLVITLTNGRKVKADVSDWEWRSQIRQLKWTNGRRWFRPTRRLVSVNVDEISSIVQRRWGL